MRYPRPAAAFGRHRAIVLPALLLALAMGSGGCDKPKVGPKRADHEAAHTERYHADAPRTYASRNAAEPAAESQPASQPQPTSGPGPVGTPVLFVNGDAISVPEILEPLLAELKDDAAKLSPQAYYNAMRRAVRQETDMHVSTLLIYQEAKTSYPDKAMEQFDKEVDRRIKEVVTDRYQGVYARYEAQLKSMDLTMADIKTRIKRQMIVAQYMRDKFKPMLQEPARRQLHAYYDEHVEDFTTPDRAELFLIEIPIEAALGKPQNLATAQEMAEARARAVAQLKRAREELDSGVEFAAVARAYSKGLKAIQGGALGEISPGTLQGRWAKAAEVAFSLSENGTSDVIDTPESVFIVRCGRRTPAHRVSFEEAQSKIMERLKEEQFSRFTQEHIQELITKATIEPLTAFMEAVMAAAPRPAVPAFAGQDSKSPQ